MSNTWSLSFVAKGKKDAKEIVAFDRHVPEAIKVLVAAAIDGIDGRDEDHILVEGHGHMAEGKGTFNTTTVRLKVHPLKIASPTPRIAHSNG